MMESMYTPLPIWNLHLQGYNPLVSFPTLISLIPFPRNYILNSSLWAEEVGIDKSGVFIMYRIPSTSHGFPNNTLDIRAQNGHLSGVTIS